MLRLSLGLGLSAGASSGTIAALSLNFLTGSLDSRITFTRASSGTYVNSSGLIASASTDVARFDYNPSTLAARGLLIEEQRTNLCLYSSDLTNAAWTKSNMTTALTATGPDGAVNSATTLTATAGNATALQTITSASAARATTCYIKRRTGTGVVDMTQDNGTTWAAVTVTANWTRVSITSATVTNPTIGLRIVTSGDAVDVGYFQCETGAFATSAIPTTSATVTRSADAASMTGTNFSSWYNQAEGTFVAVASVLGNQSNPGVYRATDGLNDYLQVYYGSTNNVVRVTDGGVHQASFSLGAVTAGTTYKTALAAKVNDFAACVNGGAVSTDVLGTMPTGVDRIYIADIGANVAPLNGHITSLDYYNTRLPDATLQELTA